MDRDAIDRTYAWWLQNYLFFAQKYFSDGALHLIPIKEKYHEDAQNIGFTVEWEENGSLHKLRHTCLVYDHGRVINAETGDQKLCMNQQELTEFILGSFRPLMSRQVSNQQNADYYMHRRGLL